MPPPDPLVCLCIPTYNAAATIHATVASLLAQTYPHFIVKISDNASTDNTLDIVAAFNDPRISVFQHASNIGAEANFSHCISLGEGAYSGIFHADDVYEPRMLAEQVGYLESHPEVGAVFTEATVIDASGREIGAVGKPPGPEQPVCVFDFSELLPALARYSNFLICPSALVRTRIYQEEIRQWRGDEFKSSADLDVWLRIAQQHRIAVLREKLMRYRFSASQGTTKLIRDRTLEADFFRVMDFYLQSPTVQPFLGQYILRHYGWLRRSDRMVRAVNLFLAGQFEQARSLCADAFGADALIAAMTGARGAQTWLIGIYLRVLMFFHLGAGGDASFGYRSLRLIKKLSRR